MVRRTSFGWLALSLIWGSTWLFIKIGLGDLPPFSFAAIRFLLAAVPLVIMVRVRRLPLPRSAPDWRVLLITGVLGVSLSYGLVFWGEEHISSGLTSILFTTYPLFGQVFAHLLLPSEPLRLRKVAGALLGLTGVALIFAHQLDADDLRQPLGSLAVVVAAAAAAQVGVLIKGRAGHLDPLLVTTVHMVVGFVPLATAGLLLEGNPFLLRWTSLAVISLVYLALVGSSLAFVIWYWLIKTTEVTKAQLLPLVNTMVAVVLGYLVLDEELGPWALAGGSAIVAGLALSLLGRRNGNA